MCKVGDARLHAAEPSEEGKSRHRHDEPSRLDGENSPDEDPFPRPEVREGKEDPKDRARGPDDRLERREHEGESCSCEPADKIEGEEAGPAEFRFNLRAEKIKSEHVEENMGEPGMHEHIGDRRPWPLQDMGRDEHHHFHQAGDRLGENERGDICYDEADCPLRHDLRPRPPR